VRIAREHAQSVQIIYDAWEPEYATWLRLHAPTQHREAIAAEMARWGAQHARQPAFPDMMQPEQSSSLPGSSHGATSEYDEVATAPVDRVDTSEEIDAVGVRDKHQLNWLHACSLGG